MICPRGFLGFLFATVLPLTGAPPNELSIATYNVANYNLTDRQIEGGFMTQYPKPEIEKTALRRVIGELDVDVLVLQEIGGESFLRELQRDLRSEGLDYPHTTVLAAADDQRRVGALSRIPFSKVGRHTDLDFKYFEGREFVKRGMLEMRFEVEAGELTVFVLHLKSRLTERRDDPLAERRRGAEATAARDRILELFPDPGEHDFMILGDLNSGPRDRPVRAFSRRGNLEIAHLVPVSDSRGETWTHRYRRNDAYTRVDHVLVSERLLRSVRDGHGVISDQPDVMRASDHRPVTVRLSWDPRTDGEGELTNR